MYVPLARRWTSANRRKLADEASLLSVSVSVGGKTDTSISYLGPVRSRPSMPLPWLNTTVSQKSDHLGLAPTRQARGVGEEGAPVEPVQCRDGGGDMAFRPHRELPAA